MSTLSAAAAAAMTGTALRCSALCFLSSHKHVQINIHRSSGPGISFHHHHIRAVSDNSLCITHVQLLMHATGSTSSPTHHAQESPFYRHTLLHRSDTARHLYRSSHHPRYQRVVVTPPSWPTMQDRPVSQLHDRAAPRAPDFRLPQSAADARISSTTPPTALTT
jgi:hypothetical protein